MKTAVGIHVFEPICDDPRMIILDAFGWRSGVLSYHTRDIKFVRIYLYEFCVCEFPLTRCGAETASAKGSRPRRTRRRRGTQRQTGEQQRRTGQQQRRTGQQQRQTGQQQRRTEQQQRQKRE